MLSNREDAVVLAPREDAGFEHITDFVCQSSSGAVYNFCCFSPKMRQTKTANRSIGSLFLIPYTGLVA
jgi:hypothetical protein